MSYPAFNAGQFQSIQFSSATAANTRTFTLGSLTAGLSSALLLCGLTLYPTNTTPLTITSAVLHSASVDIDMTIWKQATYSAGFPVPETYFFFLPNPPSGSGYSIILTFSAATVKAGLLGVAMIGSVDLSSPLSTALDSIEAVDAHTIGGAITMNAGGDRMVFAVEGHSGISKGPATPTDGTNTLVAGESGSNAGATDITGWFGWRYMAAGSSAAIGVSHVSPDQWHLSTVFIRGLTNLPVAVADTAVVAKNDPIGVLIDVLSNDTASAGIDTSSLVIESMPATGSLTIEAGRFRYIPATDFQGTATFTYSFADLNGERSDPAQVSVTVQAGLPRLRARLRLADGSTAAVEVALPSDAGGVPIVRPQIGILRVTAGSASIRLASDTSDYTTTLGSAPLNISGTVLANKGLKQFDTGVVSDIVLQELGIAPGPMTDAQRDTLLGAIKGRLFGIATTPVSPAGQAGADLVVDLTSAIQDPRGLAQVTACSVTSGTSVAVTIQPGGNDLSVSLGLAGLTAAGSCVLTYTVDNGFQTATGTINASWSAKATTSNTLLPYNGGWFGVIGLGLSPSHKQAKDGNLAVQSFINYLNKKIVGLRRNNRYAKDSSEVGTYSVGDTGKYVYEIRKDSGGLPDLSSGGLLGKTAPYVPKNIASGSTSDALLYFPYFPLAAPAAAQSAGSKLWIVYRNVHADPTNNWSTSNQTVMYQSLPATNRCGLFWQDDTKFMIDYGGTFQEVSLSSAQNVGQIIAAQWEIVYEDGQVWGNPWMGGSSGDQQKIAGNTIIRNVFPAVKYDMTINGVAIFWWRVQGTVSGASIKVLKNGATQQTLSVAQTNIQYANTPAARDALVGIPQYKAQVDANFPAMDYQVYSLTSFTVAKGDNLEIQVSAASGSPLYTEAAWNLGRAKDWRSINWLSLNNAYGQVSDGGTAGPWRYPYCWGTQDYINGIHRLAFRCTSMSP